MTPDSEENARAARQNLHDAMLGGSIQMPVCCVSGLAFELFEVLACEHARGQHPRPQTEHLTAPPRRGRIATLWRWLARAAADGDRRPDLEDHAGELYPRP